MPFTPFHFGPGALLHAVAPRQVSFMSFCAANVLIDLESLYNLVHDRHPVHAFLHTYVGATIVIGAMAALFLVARALARRARVQHLWRWRPLGLRQVLLGGALGAYSHVVLDSVMHGDIEPLQPFTAANALWSAIPLGALHLACLASGLVALMVMATRWFVMGGEAER